MLAYHLVWHMRRALAPLLFEDHDQAAAAAKAATRRTSDGQPVHSWRSLLRDLATLTRNTVRLGEAPPITMLSSPTPLQQAVLDRLAVPL